MVKLDGEIEEYENLLPEYHHTYARKMNCIQNDNNSFYLLTDSGYVNIVESVKAKLEYVQIFPRHTEEIELKKIYIIHLM